MLTKCLQKKYYTIFSSEPRVHFRFQFFEESFENIKYTYVITPRKLLVKIILNGFVELFGALGSTNEL
jgi:hypothetical protein